MRHGKHPRMTRILYIFRGLVPPGEDPWRDRFSWLSEIAEGDILLPVWAADPADASLPAFLRPGFPEYRVGRFTYHMFLEYKFPAYLRPFARMAFHVRRGIELNRRQPFDVIVSYGTNSTGVSALILKWLTGAKLVVEIPNVPENVYRYDRPDTNWWDATRRFLANRLLNLVAGAADCLKLLYPSQVNGYRKLRHHASVVFHDFVPVQTITAVVPAESTNDKYVLLVGYPWYTKGVDLLIQAFRLIADRFPDVQLKLLGYYPDCSYLDQLAVGSPQIEFLRARSNEETLPIFAGCSVYVSASRTEGMGRVLLEAMATRKPILASAVGGIPYYVAENDNGLLFAPQNVEQLAEKLALLLGDPDLRERLARRGYQRVTSELDERAYVRSFHAMLNKVTGKPA